MYWVEFGHDYDCDGLSHGWYDGGGCVHDHDHDQDQGDDGGGRGYEHCGYGGDDDGAPINFDYHPRTLDYYPDSAWLEA